jgi:hypothetical protein
VIKLDIYKNSIILRVMKTTNTSPIKFKDGKIIAVGTVCELSFTGENNIVTVNGVYRLSAGRLPRYFKKFKAPSMKTLEKWSDEGIAKSILGRRVEPDGYDSDGSPSWMLAIGII